MKPTFYITLILLSFTSCVSMYEAPAANIPIIENEGETEVSGHIGYNGVDGQLTHAFTKNWIGFSNYSYLNRERKIENDSNALQKHQYFEFGGGYTLNKIYSYKKHSIFHTFMLGVGSGSSNAKGYDAYLGDHVDLSGKYRSYFAQYNFAIEMDEASWFFTNLRLKNVSFTDYEDALEPSRTVNDYSTDGSFLEMSYGIVLKRFNFNIILQTGYSFQVRTTPVDFGYNPFRYNVGLGYNFGSKN